MGSATNEKSGTCRICFLLLIHAGEFNSRSPKSVVLPVNFSLSRVLFPHSRGWTLTARTRPPSSFRRKRLDPSSRAYWCARRVAHEIGLRPCAQSRGFLGETIANPGLQVGTCQIHSPCSCIDPPKAYQSWLTGTCLSNNSHSLARS